MKISILQPGYIPWQGLFEFMIYTDLFVVFDDVQYTKKSWRSRNKIKTANGPVWLTVPVKKHSRTALINEVEINYGTQWSFKHLKTIENSYKKAPFFQPFFTDFSNILNNKYTYLWQLNHEIMLLCMEYLNINCQIEYSSKLNLNNEDKNQKIISICKFFKADLLYDGSAAESFIEQERFLDNGIQVIFQDYIHSEHNQFWGPFIPYLSAIDLIMNCGEKSKSVIEKSFEERGYPKNLYNLANNKNL